MIAAAVPIAMQVGGSIIGGMMGNKKAAEAERARRKAIEALLGVNEQTGPSAVENEDPGARNSQTAALAELENMYRQGGMDPQSEAALREAQAQTSAAERGARDALAQNAAARGMSGSGAAFAAQLANQQGAADRNARAGAGAAGDARVRALQAMTGAAGVAGNVRGQDYQKAGAIDAVNRFNASQRLNKAGAVASTWTGQAGAADAASQRQSDQGSAIGGGIGEIVAGYGKQKNWWE